MTQGDFLDDFCATVDQVHGQIPDRIWFATWMSSKSPFFDFPRHFAAYWREGRWPALPSRFLATLKLLGSALKVSVKILYVKGALRREGAVFRTKVREAGGVQVARTWAFSPERGRPDPFWGGYLSTLAAGPLPLLTVTEPSFSLRLCRAAFDPALNNFPYLYFVPLAHVWGSVAEQVREAWRGRPLRMELRGKEVGPEVARAFRAEVLQSATLRSLLFFVAFTEIFREFPVRRVFLTYENNPWEKMVLLARGNREVPVIGFQHSAIPRDSANFFLSRYEQARRLHPDTIYCLGEHNRGFLSRRPFYAGVDLRVGYAFRYEYLRQMRPAPANPGERVLVLLDGIEDGYFLLNLVGEFLARFGDAPPFVVRAHPNMPFPRLLARVDPRWRPALERVELSVGPLEPELARAQTVLYSGTTVSIEALKLGKPVINFPFSHFDFDPLFDFRGFRWQADNPEALRAALAEIRGLSVKDRAEGAAAAARFAELYFNFRPVPELAALAGD